MDGPLMPLDLREASANNSEQTLCLMMRMAVEWSAIVIPKEL